MKIIIKYLWILPALFVAYEFGNKLFEVLAGPEEFATIIAILVPNLTLATILAYFTGVWDFAIAILLLVIPSLNSTKKYAKYIFLWVIVWPLIPASIRYFGGVADFEIVEVSTIIICAAVSFWLYTNFSNEK